MQAGSASAGAEAQHVGTANGAPSEPTAIMQSAPVTGGGLHLDRRAAAVQVESPIDANQPTRPDTKLTGASPVSPAFENQKPDDLTIIEGIGPKVAALLHNAGITTFVQLAQSDIEQLRRILRDASLPMIQPDTWPEQSRLAASGDLDGLHILQSELKAGRRE